MNTTTISYHLSDPTYILEYLTATKSRCQVFAFKGSLGAGKTTLVRLLLHKWGVQTAVTSPTFTYVNIYHNADGQSFYHFDLYRIASQEEFIEQGFNEYLYQKNSWAFIEWPEIIEPLLDHNVCFVDLAYIHDEERVATVKIVD